MDFSVCTSVYRNDKPEYLDLALKSIINQTVPPNEIVLDIDGPISSKLEKIIQDALEHFKLKVIRLQENQGLGIAMKIGVEAASCELIARMDSDDIALSDRFEKQINCFKADENLSIVGGAITEFIDEPTNIVAKRQCPKSDEEIKKYQKDYLEVDFISRKVLIDQEEIHLTPIEFNLLKLLIEHRGKVLTHNYIQKEIWGYQDHSNQNALRVFMATLRRKIEKDTNHPHFIVTEVGVGYTFKD